MPISISSKGWVVIPAELRKKYNLHPGKTVHVIDYGGVLTIVPAVDDPIHESAGMLYLPGDLLTEALLDMRAEDKAKEDE